MSARAIPILPEGTTLNLIAPPLIRKALRTLGQARVLADENADQRFVAEPADALRAVGDLIREAEILLARAHG